MRGREPDDLAIAKALFAPDSFPGAGAGPFGTKSPELTEAEMLRNLIGDPDPTIVEEYSPDDPPLNKDNYEIPLLSPIIEGATPQTTDS